MIGVDPSAFTLRELMWMLEGKLKNEWIHTTHILITMANVNRDPKAPPIKFNDVYPYAERRKTKPAEDINDAEILKAIWLRQSGQRG